jgi:RNA polymerase sigma-70 factor (ECF subfamily)
MKGQVLPLRRVAGLIEEMSDAAVLAACASGDAAALGALFDRHHAAVYRFITRLSQVHIDDVDDLVQSTFLTVQRSAKTFRGGSAVRTWIFGVAVNVVRRESRSRGRRRRLAVAVAIEPPVGAAGLDEMTDRRQALRRLQVALADLPAPLRECFVLCQLEGVPGPEAAKALGVRVGTLYRRIHEARRRLRRCLSDTGLGDA